MEVPLAVDEKNRRIARNFAIETGNVAIQCEKRISHGDLFKEFTLLREVFVRYSENDEAFLFFVSI